MLSTWFASSEILMIACTMDITYIRY